MTIAAIVALLVKVAPFLLQLASLLIPTDAQKSEDTLKSMQDESDKLAKTGRPTWD